jgi:tRNA threonylcarbamoyladenosine biosynthesis protein TsaB
VLILAIDTCDARGSVCLLDADGATHTEAHESGEDYSTWLLPAIDRVLAAGGRRLADVTLYAATAGPGSFTGIRVALTTVKAWNEIFHQPIAAVSRLEAMASLVGQKADYIAACTDAGRGQVYGAVFRRDGVTLARLGDEAVFAPAELIQSAAELAGDGNVGWVALDAAPLANDPGWQARAALGEVVEQVSPVLAPAVGDLARRMAADGRLTDALALDANYIRRPDAEVKWKGYSKPVV